MRVTVLNPSLLLIAISSLVAAFPQEYKRAGPGGILINPAPQPPLPDNNGVSVQSIQADIFSTDDVQGDILIGMKKKSELFFFFTITNPTDFKSQLASTIKPLITTTTQLLSTDTQPQTMLNIAFSQKGLSTLNITDDLIDGEFKAGHSSKAVNDFKDVKDKWVGGLSSSDNIHGVLLFASDTQDNINTLLSDVQGKLGDSIAETYKLEGGARPGDQEGHEHFGFMDGISQPAITGFSNALPGQKSVNPGQILLGIDGDGSASSRPSWTKGGSFLVFRQLQQFVPEFDKFLIDNAVVKDGLTQEEGAELLGARMVGRWKSGAPIQLAPDADDVDLANDPSRNNDFDFSTSDASKCPFAAHIRKTSPRGDISESQQTLHRVMRAGIPYGPEVTDGERSSNTSDSSQERGLAFVSYQSNIGNGFKFLQQLWANNANFVTGGVGLDPIIGTNGGKPFNVTGLDPTQPQKQLTVMSDFVVSRGGEYFFAPPISAIDAKLSQ